MVIHEGGKYKRRDGVVSNRVIHCVGPEEVFMIVWEDSTEGLYHQNGKTYNPFNFAKPKLDNALDVVEEFMPDYSKKEPSPFVQIPRDTLSRWLLRVQRCDKGGYPTNVALEIRTFLGDAKT